MCINLLERYGDKFKVVFDECYDPKGKHTPDPLYAKILGRYGEVFVFGNETLAVDIEGHSGIKEKLKKLPYCRVHLDGDFGSGVFLFPPAHLEEVSGIIKLYRRPQISEQQREEMRARMREINSKSPRKSQSSDSPSRLEASA